MGYFIDPFKWKTYFKDKVPDIQQVNNELMK